MLVFSVAVADAAVTQRAARTPAATHPVVRQNVPRAIAAVLTVVAPASVVVAAIAGATAAVARSVVVDSNASFVVTEVAAAIATAAVAVTRQLFTMRKLRDLHPTCKSHGKLNNRNDALNCGSVCPADGVFFVVPASWKTGRRFQMKSG